VFSRYGDKVVVVVVSEFPAMPLSWRVLWQSRMFSDGIRLLTRLGV
jgi:hypothetical protein